MVRFRRSGESGKEERLGRSELQAEPSAVGSEGTSGSESGRGEHVLAPEGVWGSAFFSAAEADGKAQERRLRWERRLVEAACRGEESAVEALYRAYYDSIYRYALLRLGSPTSAEDVTSQVFLGMVKGLSRYRDEGKPFLAWLYAIAQKQVALFQRSRVRVPEQVELDEVADSAFDVAGPHDVVENQERQRAIVEALRQMPDGQREVIMLRYVLSLSVAETAAVLGRTEGAVKQLQLRALATLRSLLVSQGYLGP